MKTKHIAQRTPQEQQINYELALDTISELKGILVRIDYHNDDNKVLSNQTISNINTRINELFKEFNNRKLFAPNNDEIVKIIIETYGDLIKRYQKIYNDKFKLSPQVKPNDCFFDQLITTKIYYEVKNQNPKIKIKG